MRLAENRPVASAPVIPHDLVLDEADCAGRVANLLEPANTPAMGFKRSDHVVEAVAIHVKGKHLRGGAAGVSSSVSKLRGMERPGAADARGRLLPPAIADQAILPTVAVDVANPDA